MKHLLTGTSGKSIYSFGGQLAFLSANFVLFYLLVNQFSQESFGVWALYITVVSIADTIRQGLVQNGFTKFIIENPEEKQKITSSALLLNYAMVVLLAIVVLIVKVELATFWHTPSLIELLPHFIKSAIALGTLQFLNVLCFAKEDFKTYLTINILYAVSLITAVILLSKTQNLSLIAIINLQLAAAAIPLIYFIISGKLQLGLPSLRWVKKLVNFGKHVAGTNLMSLLFGNADIPAARHQDPAHRRARRRGHPAGGRLAM